MFDNLQEKIVKNKFPVLAGFLLILLRFSPLLLGKSLLFGDNFSLMVPGKIFTASWILKGIIPLWNPTQFAGLSWVGDINQSIFYPTTIFFMFLRPGSALSFTLLVHLFSTFIGAFFLAKTIGPKLSKYSWLLAAVFWTFSPQLMGALNNLATLQSISFIPWVIFGFIQFAQGKKNSWLYLPIIIWLQLLGGYPQHVFYSVIFGFIFSLPFVDRSNRKLPKVITIQFFRWLLLGVVTILLSTHVWLPFLQNLHQSTRSLQSVEQAQTGSLHFDELIKIVTPNFFDDATVGYKWGPGWSRPSNIFMYFTWLGVLAGCWFLIQKKKEKTDVLLIAMLLICVLISFGDTLPFYSVLQKIPVFGSSRGASTILVTGTLFGALFFSRAIFLLKFSSRRLKKFLIILATISAVSLFGFLLTHFYFDQIWATINQVLHGALSSSAFHSLGRDQVLANSILLNICIQGVLSFASLFVLNKKKYFLFTLFVFADLFFFTKQYYRFGSLSAYDQPSNISEISKVDNSLGFQYRLLTRNYNAPYSDFGAYADALNVRQPFSDSFIDKEELRSFSVLFQMKQLLTPGWNMTRNVPIINGYTTLLPKSIFYDFSSSRDEPGINRLPEISTADQNLGKWSVGYYLVDSWYPTYNEVFPSHVVVSGEGWKLYELPGALPRIRYADGSPAQITTISEDPNQLQMTIESAEEQQLIVADRFDPDWRVTVSGREVVVENHDGMRAIPLQAGTNQVRMWYAPTLFYLGLAISSLTGMGLLIGWLVWRKRWQTN